MKKNPTKIDWRTLRTHSEKLYGLLLYGDWDSGMAKHLSVYPGFPIRVIFGGPPCCDFCGEPLFYSCELPMSFIGLWWGWCNRHNDGHPETLPTYLWSTGIEGEVLLIKALERLNREHPDEYLRVLGRQSSTKGRPGNYKKLSSRHIIGAIAGTAQKKTPAPVQASAQGAVEGSY